MPKTAKTAAEEREQLEATIREAHGAVKDLRQAIKAADEAEKSLRTAAREAVDEGVSEEVQRGVEQYRDELRAAMDRGVDQVFAEFDKLRNTLMHGDKRGRGKRLDEMLEDDGG